MKIILIILTILLVGCLATTVTYETKSIPTKEIDEKIQELKAEQLKLEQLQTEIKKQVDAVQQRTESAPPKPVYLPPNAPKYEKGPTTSVTKKYDQNEPIGSGKVIEKVIIKEVKVPNTNAPDNLTVAQQLYKANAVFAVPNQANINEEIKAQLIIDPVRALEEIKKDITVGPIKSAEEIKISKIVSAKLNAPDFSITSASSTEQAIIEDSKTEWIWNLRPLKPGLHPINLVIEAQVTVNNKTTPHFIRTFDKQVMIEISTTQLVSNWWNKYWQWVFVTLLLPLGKWLYEKYSKKKEKESN